MTAAGAGDTSPAPVSGRTGAVIPTRASEAGRGPDDTEAPMESTRHELLSRISIDPNICFGKPCIRGHRIWVSLVLNLLADGWTVDRLLEEYPGLEEADVLACIAYGAETPPGS